MQLRRNSNEETEEYLTNIQALHCYTVTIIVVLLVWILNQLNIFIVDKKIAGRGVFLSVFFFVLCLFFCKIFSLKKPYMKYLITGFVVLSVSMMGTFFTYHAVLINVFPIMYSMLYSSKKMIVYTTVLSVISTIFIVFVGYQYGICDLNMVFLSVMSKEYYVKGTELVNHGFNDNPVLYLTLYYVLPRCMIYVSMIPVCNTVVNRLRDENSRANENKLLAEIDTLTGVYVRRTGEKRIAVYLEEKVGGVFCIVDFDDFKQINDTYGHMMGDKVLTNLAGCMKKNIQNEDVLMRLGGDEFGIFFPYITDLEVAKNKIQQLFNKVTACKVEEMETIRLSISLGGIVVDEGMESSYEMLYRNSDHLLYEVKKRGKCSWLIEKMESKE